MRRKHSPKSGEASRSSGLPQRRYSDVRLQRNGRVRSQTFATRSSPLKGHQDIQEPNSQNSPARGQFSLFQC